MKKLLSIGLAAMLAFGLATTSFAASDTDAAGSDNTTGAIPYVDKSVVEITKNYEATNSGTTSPAEEFTFTIEKVGVEDAAVGITKDNMPVPEIVGVSYGAGDAGSANKTKKIQVKLNGADGKTIYKGVGVYTYTIKEVVGTTAGVTYYGNPITLKVTVIEQDGQIRVAAVHTEEDPVGQKLSTITNTYSAGSLAVEKVVEGNLGDKNKKFNVKVTFAKPTGKSVKGTISYIEDGKTKTIAPEAWNDKESVEVTIALKDQETITFTNIPYEVTYTVAEDDYASEKYIAYYQYTDSNEKDDKTVNSALEQVTITNNKDGSIDTGVVLNNMPYILVLAVLAAGVAVFIIRKRRED
mgnify:CR=1 FL=1